MRGAECDCQRDGKGRGGVTRGVEVLRERARRETRERGRRKERRDKSESEERRVTRVVEVLRGSH